MSSGDTLLTQSLQARKKAELLGLRNARFAVGDVDDLELPAGSFDAALCSNGMIYFQDIAGALRRISVWLRAGGRLVFNTPMVRMHMHREPSNLTPASHQRHSGWLRSYEHLVLNTPKVRAVTAYLSCLEENMSAKPGLYHAVPGVAHARHRLALGNLYTLILWHTRPQHKGQACKNTCLQKPGLIRRHIWSCAGATCLATTLPIINLHWTLH